MAKKSGRVERVRTDLQIDESIDMQERGWKVQLIGILFIFALVFSAAIGLFGDGLLSKRKLHKNNIQVEYERLYRYEARMVLKITADKIENGLTVALPNSYLENFEIESILPEPNSNRFESDQVQYKFEGKDQADVAFYLIPRKAGNVQNSIHVNANVFEISHFIFP